MLIICPHCASSYEITTATLGGEGRTVRCPRCQTVWFASTREPALANAGAPDQEPMTETALDPQPDRATDNEDSFGAEAPGPSGMADVAAEPDPMAESAAVPHDETMPETIEDAPPLALGEENDDPSHEQQFTPGAGPFPITGGDIEAFRRRRATQRAKQKRSLPTLPTIRWPLAPLPTLLLGLAATVAVLIGWRADAVRLLPQTASFYSAIGLGVNLRGVVFENINISRENHEGIPVMVVEGEIVSVSRMAVEVPRLRFGVRKGLGAEIYHWNAMPSRTTAQPGERLTFRSRLASPPAETHDISIRFYNRRDVMAGLR